MKKTSTTEKKVRTLLDLTEEQESLKKKTDKLIKSAFQYFNMNQALFSKSQIQFLTSLQCYCECDRLSLKQVIALFSTVDSVRRLNPERNKNFMQN